MATDPSFAVFPGVPSCAELYVALAQRTAYDQDYANVIQDLVEEALVARTIFCARVRITRYPTGGIYQPPMEELMDWTQAFVHFPKEQIVYGTPVALEYIALSSQWLTVLRHRPDNRTAGSDLINQYGGIVKNMLDLMAAPHIPAFPTRLSVHLSGLSFLK
ncbi:hypothetical protein GALMADRAFT_148831 [Galerina marginata CBS 339.88]|uniref:Uncharacterized protein n=1 Tax=Galerina marginata (strain CBS 339.88) TaxID=685588 RepID=A0A067S5W5_GALM3|nr:hypothetical protein GALMADRAFT_148831 [Galerina marginata CBS 339.88]